MLKKLYRPSLSLLTDLYQLTMAYGYWKVGMGDREAAFHLFFRKHPFQGHYTVACGIETVIEYLEQYRFGEEELSYLATLRGNDQEPLFEPAFLRYLSDLRFSCDVDGVQEGEIVHPHQPLLRIVGPLIQAQLIETPLLNLVNFQTLIATKAARICQAARGEPVLEFGLRRAQGIDGGLMAARAAYVGGCAATSNVQAGQLYGIPVKGTHAHSWVMAFDTEKDAFQGYADALPNNCVFLVDTYDTIQGVRHAIEAGRDLRKAGHEMVGIRLDSGDLTQLSKDARKLLDEGGFPNAAIVASNDLDEYRIEELKAGGATINVWGVGTRLATSWDQPALGGVYKLAAIREPGEDWAPRIKLSNTPIKVSNPGLQQVRRFADGDVIYDATAACPTPVTAHDLADSSAQRVFDGPGRDLLRPILRNGERVEAASDLADARAYAAAGVREASKPRFNGLESRLVALKNRLLRDAGRNTL